ncbi:MAG: group II intron reverse transcriptase/maturase [Clostridia bacterium]
MPRLRNDSTSPTLDKVQHLQQTLYRTAKADPTRRFQALYDKVHRPDVLQRAWDQVRVNRGAAGVDRWTVTAVEAYGESRLLTELAAELRAHTYRPLPARRVWIPKPGSAEQRPLAIPAVRDRIVQAALKLVIEPVFEADFRPVSFGFRPKKTAHDALQVLLDEAFRGRHWVMETDIAHCFDAIPHDRLMTAVAARICDRHVLRLVRAFLQAGVMEGTALRHRATGTPQGGVISPLLANIYLHALDQAWERNGRGRLVRYADDLVVMCDRRAAADQALKHVTDILQGLGLEPKVAKTRVVHLTVGGEGFDVLGFHHHGVRARGRTGGKRVEFLARWPSPRAMQQARDRIRTSPTADASWSHLTW